MRYQPQGNIRYRSPHRDQSQEGRDSRQGELPMYLVDDAEVCDGLDMLSSSVTDAELRDVVAGIACEAPDSDWIDEIRSRWESHDELTSGEKGVLRRALGRHEEGDNGAASPFS